jgi:hypothetical protein
MLRLGPRSSCTEGCRKLDILTAPCLYIHGLTLLVKYLNICQTISSVHGMNTRQQNKLHIPSVRLLTKQKVVYCSSVKIFNQRPQNIFKFHINIHTLKTLLTDYFVKNAFYSTEEFLSTGHNNVEI